MIQFNIKKAENMNSIEKKIFLGFYFGITIPLIIVKILLDNGFKIDNPDPDIIFCIVMFCGVTGAFLVGYFSKNYPKKMNDYDKQNQ
jgi:hypothetical protein